MSEKYCAIPRMRILVITAERRLPDLSYVHELLSVNHKVDVQVLSRKQQANLRRTLSHIDFSAYDRILFDVLFRYLRRQAPFIRSLPCPVVIYEEDACTNYFAHSKRYRQFSHFYRVVPGTRIIVTGASVAERLRAEGFDAHFLCKGYDERKIYREINTPRDIELGFIGRIGSNAYAERKRLLESLQACEPLQMLRTEPGEAYRRMLNRIRYFIGADVQFGEYMAKNFEAMACGCVLLAWRQGSEEPAIGLQHGQHLLLYSCLDELREHLTRLREDPQLASRIAEQGRLFAEQHLSFSRLAQGLENLTIAPFAAPPPPPGLWLKISDWWRSFR